MSNRRKHLSAVVAAGLAVILLSVFAVQVQSGPPAQATKPYRSYLPVLQMTGAINIQGTVTNRTSPAAGETIRLMLSHDGGANFHEAAKTVTNGSGFYQLSVPVYYGTDRFYATWKNGTTDNNKLWSFQCNVQTATTQDRICNFNIQDVRLRDPDPGAAVYFPLTFEWAPRATTTDSYAVTVHNDDPTKTIRFRTSYVGYTDRVTVATAPPGSVIGRRYYWSVRIQTPDGIGDAFWLNAIYFNDLNSGGSALRESSEWEAEQGEAGPEGDRLRE